MVFSPVLRAFFALRPLGRRVPGGGDAGSLLPGVLPPELGAFVMGHRQRSLINILSAPPPPPKDQTGCRLLLCCPSLDFHGRVRVVRSMYLPAALHGIEASLLASESLRRLRSAVRRVVWSRRQPLASVGAVLSLLEGPTGCDPAFCVVWFRFCLLRRYLALWPAEVGRVYRLLAVVHEGCPGHGPIHLLVASAVEIGFRWDPLTFAWSRPGLSLLSNLAGPIQHFQAAILDAWRNKVAADLCCRQGFRGGPLLDVYGSLQLLNSSHVRERDKALLRTIMVGGVWNGLLPWSSAKSGGSL